MRAGGYYHYLMNIDHNGNATLERHIKCMVLPGQTWLLSHTNSILVTKVASRVSVMKVAWLGCTQMLTRAIAIKLLHAVGHVIVHAFYYVIGMH